MELRDLRHNPCLMAPATALMFVILGLFWTTALIWQFPIFFLGLLVSPLVSRQAFLIEFLYPTSLGRWAHLFLVGLVGKTRLAKKSTSDKNRGFHSRSLETRVEVVPGRVYIHPLPQFLDNLGYLVVCLPPDPTTVVAATEQRKSSSGGANKVTVMHHRKNAIVGFVVDCGSAPEVLRHITLISEKHYQKRKIVVQQILSTHKHHDHTAGNLAFKQELGGDVVKLIVGGVVERVPGCNYPVANGTTLPLPQDGANSMADCVQVETVATPGHTRGSVTYVMRPTGGGGANAATGGLAYLFTGDTMFCGGAGVPFEADFDPGQEAKDQKRDFRSLIKASASTHAVERALVEIMVRSVPLPRTSDSSKSNKSLDVAERIFIMPGHEYTSELLSRQFSNDTHKWKHETPSTFFATASQLYVALHRRTLPHSSGKLLCAVGSPLKKELSINPFFRTLHTRGELLLQAIQFWHAKFCKKKVPDWIPSSEGAMMNGFSGHTKNQTSPKTPATTSQWNLDGSDLNRSVFTTVFSADLEAIVQDLSQGNLSPNAAAQRLRGLSKNLEVPVLTRKPVPGSMPSDRSVYRGMLALVLLGSAPNALSYSDAEKMKLPEPVKHSNDIPISRSRLITILRWLQLIRDDNEGRRYEAMIYQLWKEALEDSGAAFYVEKLNSYDSGDIETSLVPDILNLVDLKWSIYGVPRQPPSPWSYCMPCSKSPRQDSSHPVHQSGLKPSSGEIVRHDVVHCFLCQNAAGCPHVESKDTVVQEGMGSDRPVLAQYGSIDEEDGVEVTSASDELFKWTSEGARAVEL